ncbi:hypothetical protein LT330_006859 [Penicillium expansum]|nr:hypothetical protein LT330_006859 [Penicillium expansum]
MDGYELGEGVNIHRGTLPHGLYEQAKSLGVDLPFDSAITEYWEDDDQAGVIIDSEQRSAADCVVGANGVHTEFRTCFSAILLAGDPECKWVLEEAGMQDRMRRYVTTGGLGWTLATSKRGHNAMRVFQDNTGH